MSYFGGVGEEGEVVTVFNMLFVDNWRGKREGMMEIDYDKMYGTVGTKRNSTFTHILRTICFLSRLSKF